MPALVSVMMPCFNAADTLPLALASLRAQTLTDWECVCVDDGSADDTWSILQRAADQDPRIRIERFTKNRGRGAARQRSLELATGTYLAFLDSDDWMYPDRLSHEAGWLQADAKLQAVSVCAAVTNGPEELVGIMKPRVTGGLPQVVHFTKPRPPPILFPPSMIRTDLAKATKFDPEFLRSQDSDFLIRALLGKHFALSDRVLYAYSQASAASLQRTLDGYRFRMRAHARHWREHPVRVARTIAVTVAKMGVYWAAGRAGLDRKLIERRWGPTTTEETARFRAALQSVQAHL
jgi:glycosyltransferase involved in cell wall biosynthesis